MSLLQRRLIVLAVLVFAFFFALSQLFGVRTIIVESSGRGSAIQAEASKLVHASVWQSNLLTLNDGTLASGLQQVDPVLRTVTVRRKWSHSVIITAVLKQPSMGWTTGDQQYLLDSDGTAIGVLPGGSTLPMVTDGSNLPVQIGQPVAPEQFVAFVTALAPALKADGVIATGMSITDTTLDLTVSTNKGYNLIFDTSRTVAGEISDLKAVQALLVSQNKTPTQYIDLRIIGRAYYK